MIKLKRVYDPPSGQDGFRVLVDQLWPRGMRKEDAALDRWMKEVAPSRELRQWFDHDPEKWAEFKERYFAELDAQPEAWAPLVEAASKGTLTLLYSAREREYNKILGKVLGDRTQIELKIDSGSKGESTVSIEVYPLDPVGRKLMFGARKGISRTVATWLIAHLEHRLPKESQAGPTSR